MREWRYIRLISIYHCSAPWVTLIIIQPLRKLCYLGEGFISNSLPWYSPTSVSKSKVLLPWCALKENLRKSILQLIIIKNSEFKVSVVLEWLSVLFQVENFQFSSVPLNLLCVPRVQRYVCLNLSKPVYIQLYCTHV